MDFFEKKNLSLLLFFVTLLKDAASEILMAGSKVRPKKPEPPVNNGFLEDINFDNFFEDIGLNIDHSTPEHVRVPFGFNPSDRNEFKYSGQESTNTEILSNVDPYKDDFFTSGSKHFENFDPYSSRSFNHDDYGPPKGFFDENFSYSDNEHESNGDGYDPKASHTNYNYGNTDEKNRKATEKCVEKKKGNMVCEVCKDDYGGFSEHCSHSLHRGKDQNCANTKRQTLDNYYKPRESSDLNHRSASVPTPQKSAPLYSPEEYQKNSKSSHKDEKNRYDEPLKKSDSRRTEDPVSPHSHLIYKNSDFGKDHPYVPNGSKNKQDSVRNFAPLDSEANYQFLGKMLKEFEEKDRKNCKKIINKKGMTCYQCKNKRGHIHEECMYENASNEDGVHLMYMEEKSY